MALDVANSVILRGDEAQSLDRFSVPEQIESFCEAAIELSAERECFGLLQPPPPQQQMTLIDLREATDRYFRSTIMNGREDDLLLANLLQACSTALRNNMQAESLAAATAHSVLRLIHGPDRERIRICGNCGWLFIDRSKNRSRIWCDMTVCGNRQKAARHYRRKKENAS